MLLQINPQNPQPRLIAQVAAQLRKGAVICYPTDTVYGIGCDIFNQKAVKRVHQIKRRPAEKPFSFMCASFRDVPKIMTSRQKTVGIRVPDNNICRELVAALGNPILTTSATLENDELPMTEAYDVAEAFACHVDCVIDGGPVYPEPSTIISLVGDQPEVLRHGKGRADAFLF